VKALLLFAFTHQQSYNPTSAYKGEAPLIIGGKIKKAGLYSARPSINLFNDDRST
jgi:hypothetical protein